MIQCPRCGNLHVFQFTYWGLSGRMCGDDSCAYVWGLGGILVGLREKIYEEVFRHYFPAELVRRPAGGVQ